MTSDLITDAWGRFHAANPHIYQEMEARALALLAVGAKRIGVAAIYEAMRYDHAIRTRGDAFKLNNDYRALYARLLIARHPDLKSVIEIRKRISERTVA